MIRRTRSIATVTLWAALAVGCGGGGDGDPADEDVTQAPDTPETMDGTVTDDPGIPPECVTDGDCDGKFDDLGPCETAFCNGAVAGGTCDRKYLEDDSPCEDGDPCTQDDQCLAGQCTAGAECECRQDAVCKFRINDMGQCETYFCNPDIAGGTCGRKPLEDGKECDDKNPCTKDDFCEGGVCLPGDPLDCDCRKHEDCLPLEDGNFCNGTLICDLQHFPYKCQVDPFTIIVCEKTGDTFCRKSTCVMETGACEMMPANNGEVCDDNDVCTAVSACQSGVCSAFELVDCNDDEVCTQDHCVDGVGCVNTPVDGGCSDGNACSENDACADGLCEGGPTVNCDNGLFCDGEEACEPETGCMAGAPPDCDDAIPCTEDTCDPVLDQCLSTVIDTSKEGPLGDDTCVDQVDNDCDGLTDGTDPECAFGIVAVAPAEGPSTGGTSVTLTGGSLDLVETLLFAGQALTFTGVSPEQITLTTPPHAVGWVAVTISNGWIDFTLDDAFRYTGGNDDPNLSVTFDGPATHTMAEGETLSGVSASVVVTGGPADPAGLLVQAGYGPKDSAPWVDPEWAWVELASQGVTVETISYQGDITVGLGGYFDMAVRVSADGGQTFEFGDMDGSDNGYSLDAVADLTVWGVAEAGEIVVNELLWMGSNDSTYDEWFELRNMTRAPYDLAGFSISKAGPVGTTLVFGEQAHTVNNLVLEPWGYFLVAEFDPQGSALNVQADIVTNNTMVLPNGAPVTYQLMNSGGGVVDEALFTGTAGFNGDALLGEPDKSMERNLDPGTGTLESDWHTAFGHEGWDGDPFQAKNWGTPGGPNSDIPICVHDGECAGSYPEIETTNCERRYCLQPPGRCGIEDLEAGTACEDGLFCTDGDTCEVGLCAGGPRDCSDGDLCTQDTCDEDGDQCVNTPTDCDDLNPCTTDTCNPVDGECLNVPVDCDDGQACTTDYCHPDTGACHNDPVDCDDQDACTVDACLVDTGECSHIVIACGDKDPCTPDTCDAVAGCQHGEPFPGCQGCAESPDCADDSLCTWDVCEQGLCFYFPVDCSDSDPCTEDLCTDLTGQCHWPAKACDDGNPCTLGSCDPTTGECVFVLKPENQEGPGGADNCEDGVDNDCDDLTDGDDPQCHLTLVAVAPFEQPLGSAGAITLTGTGLDLVTEVIFGGQVSIPFVMVDPQHITADLPAQETTGDYDVGVLDGTLSLVIEGGLRVIDTTSAIWGNTQYPVNPITITVGQATVPLHGQVFVAGVTDSGGDPASIHAQAGHGPAGSDPFTDGGWTWVEADWNELCTSCGTTFEFTGTLSPALAGAYIIGFRFSVDGGYHWAFGDLGAGSSDGWNPDSALKLTVSD